MNTIEASQHLYLVRIWFESTRSDRQSWRGLVEHVPTGKKLYFTSLADLNDFISLSLPSPDTASTARFPDQGEQ